jgi:hypothetical protein
LERLGFQSYAAITLVSVCVWSSGLVEAKLIPIATTHHTEPTLNGSFSPTPNPGKLDLDTHMVMGSNTQKAGVTIGVTALTIYFLSVYYQLDTVVYR